MLTAAASDRPSARGRWIGAAALVLAAVLAFGNSLAVPFFFDDPLAILENPTIRDLGQLGQVLSPPRNGSGVAGRPVVNLSLAVNYALGGTNPAGYHVANLLFHAAAGLALFGCVRRTLARAPFDERVRAASLPLAFFTAALWLVHPLQTESVTCVIQRTEVLVGLFYFLTLYGFIRAAETPSPLWAGVTVASAFLGMASKEVMVTAPVLVFLYDRTFLAGSFAEAWRRRKWLHVGIASAWLLLAWLVAGAGGTRGAAAGFGIGVTWWSYALKQCEAILLYLKLSAWPNPLVVFYGVDVVTRPLAVWPQVLGLLLLVAATLYALVRRPVLGFLGCWCLVILSPSSSVVPLVSQTVSEHRMYLSLAAPVALAVVFLYLRIGRLAHGVAGAAVVALALTSWARNTVYHSDLSIWNDTVAKAPNNARARVNLGASLKIAGHRAAALEQFKAAYRLDPLSAESLNNIASILLDEGRPAEAIEPAQAALRIKPEFALAHNNLGTALVQTGRVADGIGHLQAALKINPDLPEAHCNLIPAMLLTGRPDQAIAHGEAATRLRPGFALAYFQLANVFLQTQQPDRAIAALQAAIQAQPAYPDALLNLGSLYYQKGDPARAIPYYEAVLRYTPTSIDAHNNLASALFQTGRTEEAIAHYRESIRLRPDYAEAHSNLGLVLERLGRNTEAMDSYAAALKLKPDDARAREGLARTRAASLPKP